MTDNIVDFPVKDNHLTGTAKCMMCRHEWIAVVPIGTLWFECPACKGKAGRYVNQVEKDGDHWHCKCGNDLFYIRPNDIYCSRCGVTCVFK